MSRNEPCACGSGKRFKHCHGAAGPAVLAADPQPAQSQQAPSQIRLEALAAHRAGSLGRADELYRQALQENPADMETK